jgi:hypothetical protein
MTTGTPPPIVFRVERDMEDEPVKPGALLERDGLPDGHGELPRTAEGKDGHGDSMTCALPAEQRKAASECPYRLCDAHVRARHPPEPCSGPSVSVAGPLPRHPAASKS